MSATITQIVSDAVLIIGQVGGTGVNEFGEDQLIAAAVRGFNMMFKKDFWPQYLNWYSFALDGTLGVASSNVFSSVVQLDFEDFVAVFRDAETVPLPVKPRNMNPYTLTSAGTKVLFWDSLHVSSAHFTNRRLQFYPKASVGSVNVLIRQHPLTAPATQLTGDDTLHLDRDLLALAAAAEIMGGDDLNANALETVRAMLEDRWRTIQAGKSKHRIPVSGTTGIPNDWHVIP
jgi:hypothetical protein